jgi:hypothetical protein
MDTREIPFHSIVQTFKLRSYLSSLHPHPIQYACATVISDNQSKKKKSPPNLHGLMARRRAYERLFELCHGPWLHDIAHGTFRRAYVPPQVNLRCHPTLLA